MSIAQTLNTFINCARNCCTRLSACYAPPSYLPLFELGNVVCWQEELLQTSVSSTYA
jgi:hypothetical protein